MRAAGWALRRRAEKADGRLGRGLHAGGGETRADLVRRREERAVPADGHHEIVRALDARARAVAAQAAALAVAPPSHCGGRDPPVDPPPCSRRNVVLTPPIGGSIWDTEPRHSRSIARGLAELLAGGRPTNLVNPEALEEI